MTECKDSSQDGKLDQPLTGNGATNAQALANLNQKILNDMKKSDKLKACHDCTCPHKNGKCEPYLKWDDEIKESEYFGPQGFTQENGTIVVGQGITKDAGSKFTIKCRCIYYKPVYVLAALSVAAPVAARARVASGRRDRSG